MTKLDKLRLACNSLVAAADELEECCTSSGVPVAEDCLAARKKVGEGKQQTIKFGFLSFLKNPVIENTNDEGGRQARSSLQAMWAIHSLKPEMMTYLGSGITDKVKQVLELDTPKKRKAEQEKASKATKKSKESEATPRSKRARDEDDIDA